MAWLDVSGKTAWGRGFAFMAVEVKELAAQTSRATVEIGGQITAIQAAGAIEQISQTIAAINEISGMIAATVTEQAAATTDISRKASQAARGTQDVTTAIAGVPGSAGETGSAASQVLMAAAELATQSLTVKAAPSHTVPRPRGHELCRRPDRRPGPRSRCPRRSKGHDSFCVQTSSGRAALPQFRRRSWSGQE